MTRRITLSLLLLLAACGGGDKESTGMTCDEEGASLCGTFDSTDLTTPVQCNFAAVEVSDFSDPPDPANIWDEGANSITGVSVDVLPWPYALNDLDFWDGEEMYIMVICDSNDDGEFTAADVQGVYGGDAAEAAIVPSSNLDITL